MEQCASNIVLEVVTARAGSDINSSWRGLSQVTVLTGGGGGGGVCVRVRAQPSSVICNFTYRKEENVESVAQVKLARKVGLGFVLSWDF